MVLVTASKPKQILFLTFIGHVTRQELAEGQKDLELVISDLSPGFTVITDLSPLEVLDPDCVAEISKAMERCDEKGVGLIIRVVPDPAKDIGLNILAAFHYARPPRMVTCASLAEAANTLAV